MSDFYQVKFARTFNIPILLVKVWKRITNQGCKHTFVYLRNLDLKWYVHTREWTALVHCSHNACV